MQCTDEYGGGVVFVEGEDFTSVLSGTVVNNGAHRELLKDIRRYCEQFSLGNFPQSDFFRISIHIPIQGMTSQNW